MSLYIGEQLIAGTPKLDIVDITKTEFDALPEKDVDTYYNITDDVLPTTQAQSCSTSEEFTGGTWIDGKPIYKKTVEFGSMPNTTWKNVAHNISNIDKIWCDTAKSFAVDSGGSCIPIPFPAPAFSDQIVLALSKTTINLWCGCNRTTTLAYITVLYTKTTD